MTAEFDAQGIQILNDITTFGGFIDGFLAHFKDEYSKLPSITFPTLTIGFQDSLEVENFTQEFETRRLLNEALCLRNFNESSSITVPIEEPTFWPSSVWSEPLCWPVSRSDFNPFHELIFLRVIVVITNQLFSLPMLKVSLYHLGF